MDSPIMQFFAYAHLPASLQGISAAIANLAEGMELTLPPSAEKSAGLRKLLEAKDCLVRAAIGHPVTALELPSTALLDQVAALRERLDKTVTVVGTHHEAIALLATSVGMVTGPAAKAAEDAGPAGG